MRIAVARETDPVENRVAATPETVKKMKGLGADVGVEPDAGTKSGIPDAEFAAAGATVTDAAVKDADVVLKVRRPAASELARYKKGALVIAMMDLYGEDAALKVCDRAQLFTLAESLGGVESLIEHPGRMTHLSVAGSPLEVPADLVRLSVGIEDVDDLLADLEQALG